MADNLERRSEAEENAEALLSARPGGAVHSDDDVYLTSNQRAGGLADGRQPSGRNAEEELELVETPLAALPLEKVRPPKKVLEAIMEGKKTGKGIGPTGGAG